jgi:hypothetical protein
MGSTRFRPAATVFAGVGLICVCAGGARADTVPVSIPDATYLETDWGGPNGTSPGTITYTNTFDGIDITGTATTLGTVAGSATANANNGAGIGGSGSAYYYWEIGCGSAPDCNTTTEAPLILTASGSASASLYADGYAYVQIYEVGVVLCVGTPGAPYCNGPATSSVSYGFNWKAGLVSNIYMIAGADVDGGVNGSSEAQIDPLLSIDPGWLANHPDYYLAFSSNSDLAAVPEPGSVLLLVTMGVAALAVMVGRRRRARPSSGMICGHLVL